MLGRYKNFIIILIIIALAFIAYFYYNGAKTEGEKLLQTESPEQVDILSREIRKAISRIDSIQLDITVFNNPVLRNLIDHSKPITKEPTGRSNPFSPFGNVPVEEES